MGQAKQRGDFESRRAAAIAGGRPKKPEDNSMRIRPVYPVYRAALVTIGMAFIRAGSRG